jgi:uncharacterized phage-like protein YoqJ
MTMIIGCTGHRKFSHDQKLILSATKEMLQKFAPTEVISGMALGYDQLVVDACLELKIPFVAAVPCKGQERLWSPAQQEQYRKYLELASRVVMVDDGDYAPWKMQKRNQWIVNNSSLMITYWNGDKTGGTANCLRYAKQVKKPVEFVKIITSKA